MAKPVFRELPCPLTTSEVNERAGRIAQHMTKHAEIEARKAEITKDLGGQLKSILANVSVLSEEVVTRCERRTVSCHWEDNDDTGMQDLIRDDTGELAGESRQNPDGPQRRLPYVSGESPLGI